MAQQIGSIGSLGRRLHLNNVATICIVTLVFIWTIRFTNVLPHDWWSRSSALPKSNHINPQGLGHVDISDPTAPFIGWPLERVCSETTYVEGLVVVCDENSGGVGNIRNYMLTCFRYAIEAGATGLVMPGIHKRSDKDISDIYRSEIKPFSYLFDEQHFKTNFHASCPRITIYDNITDVPHITRPGRKATIERLNPKSFGVWRNEQLCDGAELDKHVDRFGARARQWLFDEDNGHRPSNHTPRLIRLQRGKPLGLWEWPVVRDGPEFTNTFGQLLRFNPNILRLGSVVLASMRDFARREIGSGGGDFLGVHLRTEKDATDQKGWPDYDRQSEAYLNKAAEQGLRVAYVASGNKTEVLRFARDGAEALPGFVAVSKTDLLKDQDLDELNALTWDQQGLVDYVVLAGSTYFVGNHRSSFTIWTTIKRHLKTDGLYSRPYKVGGAGDGLSFVEGDYENYWWHWIFIWDAMWP